MWPRPESRVPFPPIAFLIKNAAPPMKAPTPIPEKFVEKYEAYLATSASLLLAVQEALDAFEKKTKELNDVKESMTSFNRWKDTSGKAVIHKRLTQEVAALDMTLRTKRETYEKLQKDNEQLVKLVRLQESMEAAYADYKEDCRAAAAREWVIDEPAAPAPLGR